MDLRVAAVGGLGEQGQDSGRAQAMAMARAAILGAAATDAGQAASGQAGNLVGNQAAAAAATTSAALAALPTSLEAAGLVMAAAIQPAQAMAESNASTLRLQANASTAAAAAVALGHETPGAPQAEAARSGMALGGAADATKTALVMTPLVPAWITALHAPAIRPGPWPQRLDTPAPRKQQARDAWSDEDDEAASRQPQSDDENPDGFNSNSHDNNLLSQHQTDVLAEHADAWAPQQHRAWSAELQAALPEPVQAELERRRGVLLVAPPGRGQRGLQLWMLGFQGRDQANAAAPQAVLRRWAVRGAPAAVGGAAATASWQLWRVRREGEDGQRPVLTARSATPHAASAAELVLRVTATVLPPPLRSTTTAWLDVLEPQRLWRDLGSQWTLLLAWSPAPLPIELPR